MTKQKLQTELLASIKLQEDYHATHGGSLLNRLQRLRILKLKYPIEVILRKLNLRLELPVRFFWGKKRSLPVGDVDTKFLYYFASLGRAELPLTNFLIKNLKSNDIFYDIGANYGFFTHLAQELIQDGQVHAFEPDKAIYNFLSEDENEGGSCRSVFFNNKALSKSVGNINFYSRKKQGASGTSTTSKEAAQLRSREFDVETVSSTTLDEYCKNHLVPTIMKIDIEGGEYDMLLGAEQTLRENSPKILLEIASNDEGRELSAKVISLLISYGYSVYRLDSDGKTELLKSTINFDDLNYSYENILFTK